MINGVEVRELTRYTEAMAGRFIKAVFSTPLGRGVLTTGMALGVGLAADNQANYQPDLNPQQAGHTLVLDNLHLQAAQKIDPSIRVNLPEIQVPTGDFEVINRGGVELTRIYGPNDPDNREFVQILLQGNANKDLAKKIVNQFFMVDPMQKYLDKFTFWVRTSPTPDFNCDRASNCTNTQAIRDEIDKTHSATGIYSSETIVLINNGSVTGASALDGPGIPTIYTYAGISMTEGAGGSAPLITATELGHSILNLSDLWMYGGPSVDIGVGFPNCSRTPQVWGWNPTQYLGCLVDKDAYRSDDDTLMRGGNIFHFGTWESTWIDRLIKLFPGNYQYPPFKLSLYRNNPAFGKGFPQGSLDLGIKPVIPYGTKNMTVELIPSADKETGIPNSPGLTLQFTDTGFINRIRQEGFTLPAPKMGEGPYITLPGMSYIWRVRASPDPNLSFQDGPGWETIQATPVLKIPNTGKGEIKDYSAPRGSEKIVFPVLGGGETTKNLTPTLRWQDGNSDVFYYEVQVSKDPTFNTNPDTATVAVQWNLVHGGQTNPLNSYKAAPLEKGTTYYWRVRPRVQGDGTPSEWSTIASFKTSAKALAS